MKKLIILTSLLWVGCINEPCTEELTTIFIRMKYISHANYEKTPYDTLDECMADVTDNNGKPHYCKSEEVMREVCK